MDSLSYKINDGMLRCNKNMVSKLKKKNQMDIYIVNISNDFAY